MKAACQLGNDAGRKAACEALQIPRATFYRHIKRPDKPASDTVGEPTVPPLALSQPERQNVIKILNTERFQNRTPYEVYATLLDEGVYHCSIRTLYRILEFEHGAVKERRRGHQ